MSSGVLRMEHLPTSFVYFAIFIATSFNNDMNQK